MKGKVTKFMFAALTGAMLMAMPMTAMADRAEYPTESVDVSVPGIQNLRVMYQNGRPFVTFDNAIKDEDAGYQRVTVEWSEADQFPDDNTTHYTFIYGDDDNMVQLDAEPGKTYYVRAFMREYTYGYDDAEGNWVSSVQKFGPMSNVITYTGQVPKVEISGCETTSSSVEFVFGGYDSLNDTYRDYASVTQYNYDDNGDGVNDSDNDFYEWDGSYEWSPYENVTGFEIWRASATGSYKKIATVADTTFTDKNLKSNTKYRYRIRAYKLNAEGKKIYGDYTYKRVTTWGRDLEVKATLKGKNSVKLTWKKVSGADGYKIYRYVGYANTRAESKGTNISYSNYELVKTIKKAGTTSYTEKKLAPGETYSYFVQAYKTVSGTKRTMNVEGYASITLGFDDNFWFTKEYRKKDGSIVAEWSEITGAEGFVIQKRDPKTDVWTNVGTLAGDATTYTFAATAEEKNPSFRIYAYTDGGMNISNYNYAYPEYVQTVDRTTGITAVANADHSGVTVSWNAVPGAAYYKVYRSRQLGRYTADREFYNIPNGVTVRVLQTAGKLDATNTYYTTVPKYTEAITSTSVVDTYQGYQYLETKWDEVTQKDVETVKTQEIQKAPAMGVRYYYYVQAFGQDGTPIVENITREEWDETTESYKDVVVGTRTETYYRGGLSGKPASVVIENVSLKAPKISKVTSAKKGKAVVKWNKVAGASQYYVYYSTKKNSGYTYAGITTKTSLTVSGLNSGKKYYFKVKAATSNVAGADVYSKLSSAKNKKVK